MTTGGVFRTFLSTIIKTVVPRFKSKSSYGNIHMVDHRSISQGNGSTRQIMPWIQVKNRQEVRNFLYGEIHARHTELTDSGMFAGWKTDDVVNRLFAVYPPSSMVPGLAEEVVKKFPKGSPEYHWFKAALQYLEKKGAVKPGSVQRFVDSAIEDARTNDGFIKNWGTILNERGKSVDNYAKFMNTIRHRLSKFAWDKEGLKIFREFKNTSSKIFQVRRLDTGHDAVKDMWENLANEMQETVNKAEELASEAGEIAEEVAVGVEVVEDVAVGAEVLETLEVVGEICGSLLPCVQT